MKATNTTSDVMKKKIAKVQERNEERIKKALAKINKGTENIEKIINAKAVEVIQTLRQYGKNSKQFTDVSQQLCSIMVHSKLKSLYHNDETSNEQLRKVKVQVTAYMGTDGMGTRTEKAIEELNGLYTYTYNKNGDRVMKCTDTKRAQKISSDIANISSIGNNGAHDIIQDTYIKLWSYLQVARPLELEDTYLLKPFEIVITSSKTYRTSGNVKPVGLWHKTATNIINELFKEIERHIESNKAVRNNFVPYTDVVTELDGESIRHYRKVDPLYCDEITDFNGKVTAVTFNQNTEEVFRSVSETCGLTTMESKILKYHFYKGMSIEETADFFGITQRTVERRITSIKDKIVASGMFAKYGLIEKADKTQKAKAIYMFSIDGEYIAEFESIGTASKILRIDKGNISKVLNGKRQQTNGYIFKYQK